MNTMQTAVVFFFRDVATADKAVWELRENGFRSDDISVVFYDPMKLKELSSNSSEDIPAGEGASVGAVVGSMMGAFVGLVAITIPGVGPIMAAGPVAAVLGSITGAAVGAGAGAVTGGITAGLVDFGITQEDANVFTEHLRKGGSIVSVTGEDGNLPKAIRILNKYHPVRMSTNPTDTVRQN